MPESPPPRVLLRSEQSDGRVSVTESTMPADAKGPPLHTDDLDEAFYVIDGELTFQLGAELRTAGPGELAFALRGVPHTLANRSSAPAGFVIVCIPAGFEREFARRAAAQAGVEPPEWAMQPTPEGDPGRPPDRRALRRVTVDPRTHSPPMPRSGRGVSALLFQPATDAAVLVRRREISSRELTELLFARIDAVDPELNAVVERRQGAALAEAAAADRAIAAGREVGPLHGVPMTVKEGFNVAGLHTTWGNPAFRDYVADADATVVRGLKSAGAIVVGKTNVPFMLADFGQTANEVYGVTSNPWDTTRTPGGSSGGAATALSAGMTFLEYGSDLVGSIRIPASFCGVYGLKPSVGIVPLAGFQPPGPPADPSEMSYMSALGPLARSARDLRTALKVTAGPADPATNAYSWRLSPPRHTRLKDFRVGVVLDQRARPHFERARRAALARRRRHD
jgi:quercetin dioxygenase-like cupin family protein